MSIFSSLQNLLFKNSFYHAVRDNNRAKVAQFISSKVDINCLDKDLNTPLHIAAQYKVPSIAQKLLEAGANPNLKNSDGDTPLSIICGNKKQSYEVGDNCLQITQLLVIHKADINTVNHDGLTPLARALNQRHEDCANFLINKGDNLTYVDNKGNSLLHIACFYQLTSVIQTLLKSKVDINCKNKSGVTPLLLSCGYLRGSINLDIVKILLNHNANPFIKDKEQNSPLKNAITVHHVNAATEILLTSQNRDEVLAFLEIMNHSPNKTIRAYLEPLIRKLSFEFYLDPKENKPEKKIKI